jgi:hypothetical protein
MVGADQELTLQHLIASPLLLLLAAAPAPAPEVKLLRQEKDARVDVVVGGKPFTSYRWAPNLKKPVLFPIFTDLGAYVTRGWPVEPRPDEATDHPHHIGQWMNYGDVAGVDFWGHSEKNSSPKRGVIVHRGIDKAQGGPGAGTLEVRADWVMPDQSVALAERTRFAFEAAAGRRVIDRVTTLTAPTATIPLPDNKEGFFGLRLARPLEHPSDKNPQGTGLYRTSEGVQGEPVWGTRGRWIMLTGKLPVPGTKDSTTPVTIAVFDHPSNPGFPTHWHARTWGLLSANPLGQKALSKGKLTMNFSIAKGQAVTFAYRTLILSRAATPQEIEAEWQAWAKGGTPSPKPVP